MRTPPESGKATSSQIGTKRSPVWFDLSKISIRDPRIRSLWWNGIPSARRGFIWYNSSETFPDEGKNVSETLL